jgi:hypothetical protein
MAGEAPALRRHAAFPEIQENLGGFFRGPKSISPWGSFCQPRPQTFLDKSPAKIIICNIWIFWLIWLVSDGVFWLTWKSRG